MKWEPWNDNKNKAPVTLDVAEPPCKECKFWRPRIVTTGYGEYGGVVLCVAKDMQNDFSCYKPNDLVR